MKPEVNPDRGERPGAKVLMVLVQRGEQRSRCLTRPSRTSAACRRSVPQRADERSLSSCQCVPKAVIRCRIRQFGVQLRQERLKMSVVESADEAAADWAVDAAWVACPLSLVVAGAAVNGVS